jgi:hypothetical protein
MLFLGTEASREDKHSAKEKRASFLSRRTLMNLLKCLITEAKNMPLMLKELRSKVEAAIFQRTRNISSIKTSTI